MNLDMVTVRPETSGDESAIRDVNLQAFGGPHEAVLVEALRRDGLILVSLVAEEHGTVIGHILFSRLFIDGADAAIPALALAPMAVIPERQRQGIGSRLIEAGLTRSREIGERIVLVVGHPHYYPRFGFSHTLVGSLRSAYESDAFMALELQPCALEGVSGTVRYPAPFDADSWRRSG